MPNSPIDKGMKLFSPQPGKRPNYFSVLSQDSKNEKEKKEELSFDLPQISKPAATVRSFDFSYLRLENQKSMDRARLTLRTVLSKPQYTIESESKIQEE